LVGRLKGRDLNIHVRIILKQILRRMRGCELDSSLQDRTFANTVMSLHSSLLSVFFFFFFFFFFFDFFGCFGFSDSE
jgi:hypothetical protein